MSLIKKIVELADRHDSIDAKKHVVKLSKEVKGYKEKVRTLIEANYVDFIPSVVSNEEVTQEGCILQSEIKSMQENLKDETRNLHGANDQISRLVDDLEETKGLLGISLKLVKIDALMHKIKLSNESKRYKDVHQFLNSLEATIEDPDDQILKRLDCIKNLKHRLVVERCNLKCNLEIEFNRLVQLKEKNFPKTRAITCIISRSIQDLVACIESLVKCGYDFDGFIRFIMTNIFEPVSSRAVSLVINENDRDCIMSLSYSTEKINDELRPTYKTVFQNLEEVLSFFLKMNFEDNTNCHFLASIFSAEMPKIMDMLFENCLKYCIPKTQEERHQCPMKEDIRKLNQLFIINGFSDVDETGTIEKICDKVDDYFNLQFTQNVQATANEILKRDLHDMILISDSDDASLITTTPLTFPRSMVSKSTLELVKLLERILHQAKECAKTDTEKKKNLLETVRSVLENYPFSVQLHHSQLLSKIPQQSALFYNNCQYLCNWILTSNDLDFNDTGSVVSGLKRQGEEFFDCQVAKQKIQLLDILKDFDLSLCLNKVESEHFKPIRQCLRQMDLLRNVWQTILPSELYSNTMGGLIELISLDMLKKVTALEDISTSLSNGLVELIKTVEEKCKALFESNVNIVNVVGSWEKLMNLQFILDASLVDLQAAWKDGRLPKHFKADEVKRLIRALFQNTERRANCLQTIV